MKICIVSDSHDRADPLAAAIIEAKAAGAQAVPAVAGLAACSGTIIASY